MSEDNPQKLFVGREAIDFTATTVMSDNEIEFEFSLRDYLDRSKGVLFFYPLDFTFVCPSEIIAFHNKLGEFSARNTKVIGVSVDSHFSHIAWKNTPHNKGGIGNIEFPLVSDMKKEVSKAYQVLNDDGISMRGTFIIDEDFMLRHYHVNDLPLGRNVDEVIRIIDALDFHKENGDVCPAGWTKEKESMTPTAEGVADYLTSNAEKL
jgi:peroxiredoxin (alkyl hydroperoxide reductase subunit C)